MIIETAKINETDTFGPEDDEALVDFSEGDESGGDEIDVDDI